MTFLSYFFRWLLFSCAASVLFGVSVSGQSLGGGIDNGGGNLNLTNATGTLSPANGGNPNIGFNLDPRLLPHWRYCVAQVQLKTANCRVLVIGDSETLATNGSFASYIANSYVADLAVLLTQSGVPTNANSFMGDSTGAGTSADRFALDTARLSAGGWGTLPGTVNNTTLGGSIFENASGGSPLVYTPGVSVDTFNIFYNTFPGGGMMSFTATGGSTTTINQNASAALHTSNVTAAALQNTNALSVNDVSGEVFFEGIEAYNSTQASVNLINAGWSGSTTENWVANSANVYGPLPFVTYLAAPLVIIRSEVNDCDTAVPVATYKANLGALINTVQAYGGDVILLSSAPSNATCTAPQQAMYIAALYALSSTYKIPFLDDYSRWVSYTLSNSVGFYADNIHPNPAGHWDWASNLSSFLLSIVQ